ncbi:MAG TPA: hypothetical protein VF062_17380, partial [Candidatus Limnocylindrales bacterium]
GVARGAGILPVVSKSSHNFLHLTAPVGCLSWPDFRDDFETTARGIPLNGSRAMSEAANTLRARDLLKRLGP